MKYMHNLELLNHEKALSRKEHAPKNLQRLKIWILRGIFYLFLNIFQFAFVKDISSEGIYYLLI